MATRNTFVGAPGSALPDRRPAGDPVPRLYSPVLPDLAGITDADLVDLAYNAAGPDFDAFMASPGHVRAILALVERLDQRAHQAEELLNAEQREVLRYRKIDADRCAELVQVRETVMCLWFQLTSASKGAPPIRVSLATPPERFDFAPPARPDFDDDVVVSHTLDMPPPLPPPDEEP